MNASFRDELDLVRPGEVLLEKYRIEKLLGKGAMGAVFAATHLILEQQVAIKLLLADTFSGKEAQLRFFREARALGSLRSEHVARLMDVGVLPSGAPYIVMEYLVGYDLSQLLRTTGPFGMTTAVDHVLEVCEALAEAHARGIIHRDLKPSNLFAIKRPDGADCIKVLDFGIAKMNGSGVMKDAAMTRTGMAMGSPAYMSPEQIRGARDVDVRTDVWAIGATLHELLTGAKPFVGESLPQLCVKIIEGKPAGVRSFRLDVPRGLDEVVLLCLEKDVAKRFQSVGALARALAPFATERGFLAARRATATLGETDAVSSVSDVPVAGKPVSFTIPTETLPLKRSELNVQPSGVLKTVPMGYMPDAAALRAGLTQEASLRSQQMEIQAAPNPDMHGRTMPTWGTTSGVSRHSRSLAWVAIAIGLVVLIAVGIVEWVWPPKEKIRQAVAPTNASAPEQQAKPASSLSALAPPNSPPTRDDTKKKIDNVSPPSTSTPHVMMSASSTPPMAPALMASASALLDGGVLPLPSSSAPVRQTPPPTVPPTSTKDPFDTNR